MKSLKDKEFEHIVQRDNYKKLKNLEDSIINEIKQEKQKLKKKNGNKK